MRRAWILLLVSAGACTDLPTETPVKPALPAVVRTVAVTCDKYWTIGVGGDFDDASKWSPQGVPGTGDHACFEAAGTYTVTVSGYDHITGLHIGNNVAVTFQSAGTGDLFHTDVASVDRIARLSVVDCLKFSALQIVVDGNLTLRTDCAVGPIGFPFHELQQVQANGLLELDNVRICCPWVFEWRNVGEIILTNNSGVYLPADGFFEMAGGRMRGSGTLEVSGEGLFNWTGGTMLQRSTAFQGASLSVDAQLNLGSTSLSGAIDVQGDPVAGVRVVTGHIGPNVDLGVVGIGSVEISPPNEPLAIQGKVSVPASGALTLVAHDVVNTGLIRVNSNITFAFDKLDNQATIDVGDTLIFSSQNGAKLNNKGTVNVATGGRLVMDGSSEFLVHQGSSQTGLLELQDSTMLRGDGVAGFVIANGGTVSPGSPATPLGSFQLQGLAIGSTGRLLIDAIGANSGQFDRIVSNGSVSYGGTLELRTFGSFVPGLCGQRLDIVAYNTSGLGNKYFATYTGFQPGPRQGWRASYGTSALEIAGFDPTAPVAAFSATTVAIGEGGPSASVSICLGATMPNMTVDVTERSGQSQVSMSPARVTFLASDWMLPHSLALTALDDAVGEGPHLVSVAFNTASGDPAYNAKAIPSILANITDNDPGADLTVAVAQGPTGPVALNVNFDVRFRVSNLGPASSIGSTFTITPMAGLQFVSNGGGATCTASAGTLTCTVGAVASGGFVDLPMTFRPISSGVQSNTIAIAGQTFDHNSANNSALWSVTVN